MTERNTKIFNTVLKTVSLNTCYTVDELGECITVDDVARGVEFGAEAGELSCENPDGELDFGIELGNILPFSNEPADISVFELDGTLNVSLQINCDGYDTNSDERLNDFFVSRSMDWVIAVDSDPDILRFSTECDADVLEDITYKLGTFLRVLLEDEELESAILTLNGKGEDCGGKAFLPF